MSQATNPVPVQQAEFDSAARTAIGWYAASTPEQQALLYADYAKASGSDISVSDYVKDAAEWPSMLEYLTDVGAIKPDEPKGLKEAFERYETAVQEYAVNESKGQLDVGKWAQRVLEVGLKPIVDVADRRKKRGQLVQQCQSSLNLACVGSAPTVDKCLRLYAVSQVYGSKEQPAAKLGIGKLRAFESTLFREKDGELWAFKDTIPEAQQTVLKEVWSKACTEALSATDVQDLVSAVLGKPLSASKETPKTDSADEVKPEASNPITEASSVKPEPNTTVEERKPEVAPENPVECAKRMASLPYGRPDSEMVWRNFGSHVALSEKDAAAFVHGLADAGRLQVLAQIAKTAVEAAKHLASAPKTVEGARKVA